MSDATGVRTERADFEQQTDGWKVTLERELEVSPVQAWTWLTDSDHLRQWLAPGQLNLKPGGRVRIEFEMSGEPIDSHIIELEPERHLTYSWSNGDAPRRPLRWDLEPTDGGTWLTLTIGLLPEDQIAISAAGWDAHLQMLEAAVAGVPISFPVARFKESRTQFEEALEAHK